MAVTLSEARERPAALGVHGPQFSMAVVSARLAVVMAAVAVGSAAVGHSKAGSQGQRKCDQLLHEYLLFEP